MAAVWRFSAAVLLGVVLGSILSLGPCFAPTSQALRLTAANGRGSHGKDRTRNHPPKEERARLLTASLTVLAFPRPPIAARAALLIDMRTGKTLYSKNANDRLAIASTTKITTAIVTIHHARLNELARASQKAASIGEATMVLKAGERLTVEQLLYGLLLNSANDAAITLAEHVSGTESRFVERMNALARRLHMRNTHYATAHGLDAPHHYSSARDLATVTLYAMRNAEFRRIVSTIGYHIPRTRHNAEHWLASVNRVMYWFPGVDGVKPGQTDEAGLCQVVTAYRNGHHLLVVLLNTPTLVTDVRNLLDYGSRDFKWVGAPAFWDQPTNSINGGEGGGAWTFHLGSGHYIRGAFRRYWLSHGNLQTFGYARTEEVTVAGEKVQFFQGGELRYDRSSRAVTPVALGVQEAQRFMPRSAMRMRPRTAPGFFHEYRFYGGKGVLGLPVTSLMFLHGRETQFFEYGALTKSNGSTYLVPVGDLALKLRKWLPARGAADQYPSSMLSTATDDFVRR
ncbi:MAG: hypothetical protein NVSMB52_06270 [Chloroflexota bacterium]